MESNWVERHYRTCSNPSEEGTETMPWVPAALVVTGFLLFAGPACGAEIRVMIAAPLKQRISSSFPSLTALPRTKLLLSIHLWGLNKLDHGSASTGRIGRLS
jgi:hypothetical protein